MILYRNYMFFSKFFDFSLNFHRSISDYCRYFDECHTRISTAPEKFTLYKYALFSCVIGYVMVICFDVA